MFVICFPNMKTELSKNNKHGGQFQGYNECLKTSESFAKSESNKVIAINNPPGKVLQEKNKGACFWICFKIRFVFIADTSLIATAKYL